jgi:hypothetical protein
LRGIVVSNIHDGGRSPPASTSTPSDLAPANVSKNPKQAFYVEESLGDRKFFTAVYSDVAVAEACVACHNAHRDSPREDFKLGDVMGGIVVRIPLDRQML